MLSYYKATEDFQSSRTGSLTEKDHGSLLYVERGDIIVDVAILDAKWARGKHMISQKAGKIPRNCIEKLNLDSTESNTENEEAEQNSTDLHEKRIADIRSPTTDNSTDIEEGNVSIGSSTSRGSLRASKPGAKPPRPPTKSRKSQEVTVTNDGIKSKTADDGYNSSSYSSGEKSQDDGPNCKGSTSVPFITSFVSHRTSIQDNDGYEMIPVVPPAPPTAPRPRSIVGGVVATDKEVALKFLFKRKNSFSNDKEENRASLRIPCPPSSPDSRLESIDVIWTPMHTYTSLQALKSTTNFDRVRIPIYFVASLCLSLGFSFLFYFLAGLSVLLIFSITVVIFTMLFVGPLTFGYRRLLSIMVLLGPSLFSKKTKICLCITIAVLIIAGPICNISRNIMVAISYQNNSQLSSSYIGNTRFDKYHLSTTSKPSIIFAKEKQVVIVNPTQTMSNQSKKFNHSKDSNHSTPKDNHNQNHTTSLLQLCIHKFQIIQSACKKILKDYCQSISESTLCTSVKALCPSSSAIAYSCAAVDAINNSKPENIRIIATIKAILLEFLPLLLILFLRDAYIYNREYLSNKEMDNIYITGKLKVLDRERENRCLQEKLFPLRKLEFRKYILPSSFHLTASELKTVVKWIIIWIIIGSVILFSLLLDYYVLEALQALKGRISQEDQQYGMQFTHIDTDIKHSMVVVFSLLFVAITLQSYMLRARSRICSFFYPKRESLRGMYLYYQIIHERSRFWKFCRERIQHQAEARKFRWKIGVAHRIFAVMPKLMSKIVKKCFVYRCMICNSCSWRRSFVCNDNDCCATFCFECYIDMGESCICCNPSTHQPAYSCV